MLSDGNSHKKAQKSQKAHRLFVLSCAFLWLFSPPAASVNMEHPGIGGSFDEDRSIDCGDLHDLRYDPAAVLRCRPGHRDDASDTVGRPGPAGNMEQSVRHTARTPQTVRH